VSARRKLHASLPRGDQNWTALMSRPCGAESKNTRELCPAARLKQCARYGCVLGRDQFDTECAPATVSTLWQRPTLSLSLKSLSAGSFGVTGTRSFDGDQFIPEEHALMQAVQPFTALRSSAWSPADAVKYITHAKLKVRLWSAVYGAGQHDGCGEDAHRPRRYLARPLSVHTFEA